MTSDEQQIAALVDSFVAGWNAGSGSDCARPFAEDADFIAVNGINAKGRDVIGRGHAEILSTIFKGTQMEAKIHCIRFLRLDVAVADVTFRLRHDGEKTWIPARTSCGLVATNEEGEWSIAVFRNMVPFERPVAGSVDRSLLDARELQNA
jgi:uncharacterized protein (TIGR02246 family)